MDEQPNEQQSATLPARDFIDARTDSAPGQIRPLNHVTGAELTTADLGRTLLALRSLDHA